MCGVELHYWEDDLVVVVVEGFDKAFDCVFDWVLTLTRMQAFSTKVFHFKTDSSPHVRVFCTPDGRIDYSALGFEFVSDPTSIKLNGSRFPIEGLKSVSYRTIEVTLYMGGDRGVLQEGGKPVGMEEDPVIVTGKPVHGASTGTSKIPNLDENVSAAFVKLTLEEMKEVACYSASRRNCKKSIRVRNDSAFLESSVNSPAEFVCCIICHC